ncbi:MAG: tetratricopeptide repeat protein [Thermomicrobiales bacterium]|nr:tetratricopeptide repeat protein [Thermomicrobiales bacterium]
MVEPIASYLPSSLTALIGREGELDEAAALLSRPDVRIVTLSGPGGTGKTRLALEVAHRLAGDYEAVAFVALANVFDPAAVLPSIAQVVGIREEGDRSLTDRLNDAFKDRRLLLVLDNFEQVTGAATAVASLLAVCPGVKALVTSRLILHIRGERELPLAPLPVPDSTTSRDDLLRNPAVALFVERAQAVKPDLDLSAANVAAIAEICGRLDGLPLAIELAAARVKLLPPQSMLPRLTNRLQLLTRGPRDLPERQQTLRDAIAWSTDLLQEEERILFRRLAVFARGCTIESAETVLAGRDERVERGKAATDSLPYPLTPLPAVFDGLSALVDHSLVRQMEGADGEPRFAMLETIRDFAAEQLAAAGEETAFRDRHARYFCEFAERGRDEIAGHQQAAWLNRLDAELANVRAALNWSLERGDVATGQAIAGAMPRYWEIRGNLTEGRVWTDRALVAGADRTKERASVLIGAATLARRQGEYARAIAHYEEALGIARELNDAQTIARALNNLGVVAQDQGNYERAQELGEESLALFRAAGDRIRIAAALNNLGIVSRRKGDPERATELFEESLVIWKELGDNLRTALALNNLGVASFEAGDLPRAAARYEEALVIWRERGDRTGAALSLHNLAEVLRDQGDLARSAALWEESLALRAEQGNVAGFAESLSGLAVIAMRAGLNERAVRLLGAAEGMQQRIGYQLPPKERDQQTRATAALRAKLDAASFQRAWEAGETMSLDDAVAFVRSSAEETAAAAKAAAAREADKSAAQAAGLTRRELEVLRLVVDGNSDKEIGEALFISHRTAMTHVLNILNKLGVNSRTAAAAYALRQGLV